MSGRGIFLILEKEEHSLWPRLCQSTTKFPYIKTDFDRWIDPDAVDEEPGMPPGGFDFSNFDQSMLPDMKESEEFDSDNEDIDEEPLDEEVKKQIARENQETETVN